MVNTKRVSGRRDLRFASLDEALANAEAMATVERRGELRAVGNWTLGQAIGHLAFWANAPFDGYPPDMRKLPWLARKIVPMFKNGFLNEGLPAGGRLPGTPNGTYGVAMASTDESLNGLRRAFVRLAVQAPSVANPIFGVMTHDEWIKLNLRHAELHLSFFGSRQAGA